MSLEYFANDRYSILCILKENQVKIKDEEYIPLSQQEIADIAHFSKQKAGKILNELMTEGYVGKFKSLRGKYIVTLKGEQVIEILSNTDISEDFARG